MFHFVPARRVSNYLFLLTFQRRRTLALNLRLHEKRLWTTKDKRTFSFSGDTNVFKNYRLLQEQCERPSLLRLQTEMVLKYCTSDQYYNKKLNL